MAGTFVNKLARKLGWIREGFAAERRDDFDEAISTPECASDI
jgi:hypothetical protein